MAGEIIIRKAKKEYVCMCCNHIIKVGEEYLDRVIFVYGKPVRHDRYHDVCPTPTAVEKLIKKIEDAGGDLMAMDKYGVKIHIVGVAWNDNHEPVFLYKEWCEQTKHAMNLNTRRAAEFIDYKGDSIL